MPEEQSEKVLDAIGKVTPSGERLINNWRHATLRVERAKSELNYANNDLMVCERELGKWLCPGDAGITETFCVWYGDSLITARQVADGRYSIAVRTKGRSLR